MTDFCEAQVTAAVTTGPTFQATGRKYVVANDGDSSFKLIALDADMVGVAVGDIVRCVGKFRLHNTTAIVDSCANPPYNNISFGELPSNTEKGTLVLSATGKVTQAYTTFDANYKYFLLELDTDPGEAKIVLKIVHSNDVAAQNIANGTQPVVNSQFTNGTQVYLRKLSDTQWLDPWTIGQ